MTLTKLMLFKDKYFIKIIKFSKDIVIVININFFPTIMDLFMKIINYNLKDYIKNINFIMAYNF
jgi:hypothetical protein